MRPGSSLASNQAVEAGSHLDHDALVFYLSPQGNETRGMLCSWAFPFQMSRKQAPGDLMCCSQWVPSQLSSFLVVTDTGRSHYMCMGISLTCGGKDRPAPLCLPPLFCRHLHLSLIQFLSIAPRQTRLWLGRVWCKSCDTGEKCWQARRCFQSHWSIWVAFINYWRKSHRVTIWK